MSITAGGCMTPKGAAHSLLVCIALLSSCTAGSQISPASPMTGQLTLGAETVQNFGVTADLPLQEEDPATVPDSVSEPVREWATGRGYDTRCLRFFDGGAVYVVAAPWNCGPGEPMPDHFEVASFEMSGRPVASISELWDPDFEMVPPFRTRSNEDADPAR